MTLDAVALVRDALLKRDGGAPTKDSLTILAAVQELRNERDTLRAVLRRPPEPARGKPPESVGLSRRERAVLMDMHHLGAREEWAVYFRTLVAPEDHGGDPREVRCVVRRLARKGLAKHMRGLMNEDGFVAGSGYCLTAAGVKRAITEIAAGEDGR
ncbi:hypothetical protein UFOVP452_44 [uncultured Caudovirales phage]|uniref:Uncharacterized protein n=1 Tax=uncultured Caudovirales phage TaxID=2100421 RepID=A0A6J5MCP1_9CAUD|nr:hypothetical protein UFOVP452_44 [uncultured Caudovirales phage]